MLEKFSLDAMVSELEQQAPTFYAILNMCVDVKRRTRPVRRTFRPSVSAIVGVCASILLRNKNQRMNALQHLVSLTLHLGHAGKQVDYSLAI